MTRNTARAGLEDLSFREVACLLDSTWQPSLPLCMAYKGNLSNVSPASKQNMKSKHTLSSVITILCNCRVLPTLSALLPLTQPILLQRWIHSRIPCQIFQHRILNMLIKIIQLVIITFPIPRRIIMEAKRLVVKILLVVDLRVPCSSSLAVLLVVRAPGVLLVLPPARVVFVEERALGIDLFAVFRDFAPDLVAVKVDGRWTFFL